MNVRITGEIFTNQRYGGISRYLVALACALERQQLADTQISAALYVNEYLRLHRRELQHQGIHVSPVKGLRRISSVLNRIADGCTSWTPDVTHASHYRHGELSRSPGAKVCTFYDMIQERFGYDPLTRERKRQCYSVADRCIAISECTKSDMVHYLKAQPENIDVVYLASDIVPCPKPISAAGDFLLWVGGRGTYKNFLKFAEAFAISKAAKAGVRIWCAGGPKVSKEEKESWLGVGLNPDSVFHTSPPDEELAKLYSEAIALVYVSRYEGFGIPPLESMICSCPVISSSTGSVPEIVGDAALCVDPDSTESICDAIDRIVFSDSTRVELIQRGTTRASLFSWDKCARETFQSYQRAVQGT